MNTTANLAPAPNASILALDLGKFKSISCFWDHQNPG